MTARWALPRPTLTVRMRIHGAARALRQWAATADQASKAAGISSELAASLRGKKVAYYEAASVLDALEEATRLPRRWRNEAHR